MGLTKQMIIDHTNMDELFDVMREPPPRKILYQDDPLALAVGSYEHWIAGGGRWLELEQVRPTEENRKTAELIRHYYRERMVFEALKKTTDTGVSEFRKKLALLCDHNLEITNREIGLLMRLPYFYQEDRAVDAVVEITQPVDRYTKAEPITATFTLQQRVLRSRRSGDFYDYWMTSDHSDAAYLFVMRQDNNMRQLVESLLAQPFRAKANIYTHNMRGHWRGRPYFQVIWTGVT